MKFNLPTPPNSLLNSAVISVLSMSSNIMLFISHWTPVSVCVGAEQKKEILLCCVVTRPSGNMTEKKNSEYNDKTLTHIMISLIMDL